MSPTLSPGTSEIANVSTGAGRAAAASRPPFKFDRCLRTQLISRMSAPCRIKKFAAARFCSNVRPGSGATASEEPPPEIRQQSRSSRLQRGRELEQACTRRETRGVRRWMRGLDDLDRAGILGRQQAVAVPRDDHASDGRAPVRMKHGRHRRGGFTGAEH